MIKPIDVKRLAKTVTRGDFLRTVTELFKSSYGSEKDPRTKPFWNLWRRAGRRVCFFPASTQFHGVWMGGLNDHINDMLAYMWHLASTYAPELEAVDIAVMALVHDWEKLWKYKLVPIVVNDSGSHSRIFDTSSWGLSGLPDNLTVSNGMRIGAFLNWSGMKVSTEILNALTMSEGGWSLEAKAGRFTESSPAAALLHAADMFSAKVLRLRKSEWAIKLREQTWSIVEAQNEVNTKSPIEEVLWPS